MEEIVCLPCSDCGSINRVKVERLDEGPVCAKCKHGLETDHPIQLTAAGFDKVVGESSLPVLVDFWAPWCGPCRTMGPVLEQVAKETRGKAVVAKLDTDEHPEIAARYGIRGVPTLILFRHGTEERRQVGAVPKEAVLRLLA